MTSKKCFFTQLEKTEKYSDPNISRIQIGYVDGNKTVVGIDAIPGLTGILFYQDCVLTDSFMESHNLNKSSFKNNRVRVVRFKGEYSEVLFIPKTSSEVKELFNLEKEPKIGDSLEECKNVYSVYLPTLKQVNQKNNSQIPNYGTNYLPNFPEHYDTEQYRSHKLQIIDKLSNGWTGHLSLKLHGTCLKHDTKILMIDGSLKNIKDIEIGDYVQSKDGATKVLDTFNHKNKNNWLKLEILILPTTLTELICTKDHLIFTSNGYIEAQYLNKYSEIASTEDCIFNARLISKEDYSFDKNEDSLRYDITTDTHNFIANSIVVHNSGRVAYVLVPKSPNLLERTYLLLLKYLNNEKYKFYKKELKNKYLFTNGKYKKLIGSRRVILDSETRDKDSWYHSVSFREKAAFFLDRLEKDTVVYFEILGYEEKDKPIMAKSKSGKVYDYGLDNGEFAIKIYRIVKDGKDLPFKEMSKYSKEILKLSPVDSMYPKFKIEENSELSKEDKESLVNDYLKVIDFIVELLQKDPTNYFSYLDKEGYSITRQYFHINEGLVLRLDPPDSDKVNHPIFYKIKLPEFYLEEGMITAANLAATSLEQE